MTSLFDETEINWSDQWPRPREFECPVIVVSPEFLERISWWHCSIPKAPPKFEHRKVQKIVREPFEHEGKFYLCTGSASPPQSGPYAAPKIAHAYEVVPLSEAPDLEYREWGWYHGVRILWRNSVHVLRGPQVHFTDGVVPYERRWENRED